MAETIFERYGGFAKVSRVVSSFYDRVLDAPVLQPYFAAVDMRRLVEHQTKLVAALMGGPASYSNEHLARVHARLHVSEGAFDEMALLLRETLEDFDFDETDIATVLAGVQSRRTFIVDTPAAPGAA